MSPSSPPPPSLAWVNLVTPPSLVPPQAHAQSSSSSHAFFNTGHNSAVPPPLVNTSKAPGGHTCHPQSIWAHPLVSHIHQALSSLATCLPPNCVNLSATARVPLPLHQFECNCSSPLHPITRLPIPPCQSEHNFLSPASTMFFCARLLISQSHRVNLSAITHLLPPPHLFEPDCSFPTPTTFIRAQLLVSCLHHISLHPITHLPHHIFLSPTARLPAQPLMSHSHHVNSSLIACLLPPPRQFKPDCPLPLRQFEHNCSCLTSVMSSWSRSPMFHSHHINSSTITCVPPPPSWFEPDHSSQPMGKPLTGTYPCIHYLCHQQILMLLSSTGQHWTVP